MAVLNPPRPAPPTRAPRPPRPRRALPPALRDQLVVAAGQVGAGAGNAVFSFVLARVLSPGRFAEVAAFLALHLLLHLPAGTLGAVGAAGAGKVEAVRRIAAVAGLAVGAAIVAFLWPLAELLALPPGLVLALAAAAPVAGLVAFERGRLYGLARHRGVVATLVAEPAVRLSAGLGLAALLGAAGAATSIVLGGWTVLALALLLQRRHPRPEPPPARVTAHPVLVAAAFLGLAVVQTQDLLLANRLLSDLEAGQFAAVSTLGGIAAFATATVPLVLLPGAVAGRPHVVRAALAVALSLGAGAVLVTMLAPGALVTAAFGPAYAGAAHLAVPYMSAMALLGIGRVLVAARLGRGRAGFALAAVTLSAAVQTTLLVTGERSATGVVTATVVGTATLAGLLAAAEAWPALRAALARVDARVVAGVTASTALGLAARLVITRGLWLDEATSVAQAQLPFAAMLEAVRYGDVHPPLHHVVLWAVVRVLGTGEFAVRLPSIVAGTALIPVLYLAGRELYDRRTGLIAALLGAVAPMAVWYSQEARMYAFFMLFAVLAVWGQVSALRRGRWWHWAVYGLASAGMLWTQYFSLLSIAVQQVAIGWIVIGGWRARAPMRRLLIGWGATTALLVLSALPLWPILSDQLVAYGNRGVGLAAAPVSAGGGAAWQTDLSLYVIAANVVWALWGYHTDAVMVLLVALWPLAMLGGLLALGRGRSPSTALLVAFAAAPATVLFLVGLAKRDLFELRYFLLLVPVVLLLTAHAVARLRPGRGARLALGLLLVSLAGGLVDQQVNSDLPRRYAFETALREVGEQARPGDLVLYEPWYLNDLVDYYAPGVTARAVPEELDPALLPLQGDRRVFLVGSFLDQPRHAERTGWARGLLDYHRERQDHEQYPNVDVWMYR